MVARRCIAARHIDLRRMKSTYSAHHSIADVSAGDDASLGVIEAVRYTLPHRARALLTPSLRVFHSGS